MVTSDDGCAGGASRASAARQVLLIKSGLPVQRISSVGGRGDLSRARDRPRVDAVAAFSTNQSRRPRRDAPPPRGQPQGWRPAPCSGAAQGTRTGRAAATTPKSVDLEDTILGPLGRRLDAEEKAKGRRRRSSSSASRRRTRQARSGRRRTSSRPSTTTRASRRRRRRRRTTPSARRSRRRRPPPTPSSTPTTPTTTRLS